MAVIDLVRTERGPTKSAARRQSTRERSSTSASTGRAAITWERRTRRAAAAAWWTGYNREEYAGGDYGPLGFTQDIVDTNGGTVLNKRSGPETGCAAVGTVADGVTISVSCSLNGTSHTERWGTTRLWNRLTDGTRVSDGFVATGSNGPLNGWC